MMGKALEQTRSQVSIFAYIAEQRIQEAIQRGDLDNLSLRGQPLPREDFTAVPEELRMAYKVLKNAGYLPEEVQLQQELLSLHNLLDACMDAMEEQTVRRRLSLRQLHLDLLMEKKGRNLATQEYAGALTSRLLSGNAP